MPAMKWIKFDTEFFDDDVIRIIQRKEHGMDLILLWVKLLCFAGKKNNGGVFMLTDSKPHTADTLSAVLYVDRQIVDEGLECFVELGMMDNIDGVFVIPDWAVMQNTEQFDKKRERDREYRRKKRAEQRNLINSKSTKSKNKDIQKPDIDDTDSTYVRSVEEFASRYLSTENAWKNGISESEKLKEVIANASMIDETELSDYINSMDYKDFLKTKYWKAVAAYKRYRAKYKCELCGSKNDTLHIHHKNYDAHGREHTLSVISENLMCLCEKCHKKIHGMEDESCSG